MTHPNILIVDDNPGMVQTLAGILLEVGEVRFATNGPAALRSMGQFLPDIILLDAEMPGMDGFEVCTLIRTDPELSDVPVIMVTAHHDAEFELAGFRAGAADFVTKPVSPQLLVARVKTHLRLKNATDEMRRVSKVDPLTMLANRNHFEDMVEREWRRGRRCGHPLAAAMLEIDYFDLLVERHGRRAGEDCLQAVANVLREIGTRPADVTARFDHHIFAMLLPVTTRTGAESVGQRVISTIESLDIPHAASPVSKHVTVSVGIGCYDEQSADWAGPTGTSGLMPMDTVLRRPQHLQESALLAMEAARRGGRSQAWWLDVSNSETPELAREILA